VTAKDPKHPLHGVDLSSARTELAGLPQRRLDTDWLALDKNGHVALFVGNERGLVREAGRRRARAS
jgi:hypothetical protein